MSFSGCSVCDYSSGHVPNLWPKGWLVVIMRVSTVSVQTSCEDKTYSVLRSAGAASASAEVLRRWVQQQQQQEEEEEEAGDEVQGANMHQLSTSPPSLQLPCSEPASAEASPACSLTPRGSGRRREAAAEEAATAASLLAPQTPTDGTFWRHSYFQLFWLGNKLRGQITVFSWS